MFVDISFNLPMDRLWTYSVPINLQDNIKIGTKVRASFLSQSKLGIVVKIHNNTPSFNTKAIDATIQDNIHLPPYIFFMRDKIAEYYGCSENEALHLFMFEAKERKNKTTSPSNKSSKKPIELKELILNKEQQIVVDTIIKDSINLSSFVSGLIHGITGSGKTQVYQSLIKQVNQNGKQALLLLPEIGITTQIYQRFCEYFSSEDIAFIHSKMTTLEKHKMLIGINNGSKKIIIGPRSALFSPFNNLGLILMDEEQDFSYKSQKSPRYHTKRVAFILAQYLNIPFIMGSATPSIETYFAAMNNKIKLYTLTQRYYNTPLPQVHLVDMNQEQNFFTPLLMQKIAQVHQRAKQSILFMNRRGFSPILLCHFCHYIFKCPDCSITLTYHKQKGFIVCHYCGFKQHTPSLCPECHKNDLRAKGLGTQRIEEEIQELFHSYKILRMDKDTTRKKNAYEDIIQAFEHKQADILVGTQMLTKGLDFPSVELVGILSCDMLLNLPDFRGSEYTFNLITQVSGRSGRKTEGEVILQTRFPEHYAIQNALKQNYKDFYFKEITLREEYKYPPYFKFIRILVRSSNQQKAKDITEVLSEKIKSQFKKIDILGPSICLLERINKQYRYHFLIKVKEPISYIKIIKPIIKELNNKGDYHIECDVDPITLL